MSSEMSFFNEILEAPHLSSFKTVIFKSQHCDVDIVIPPAVPRYPKTTYWSDPINPTFSHSVLPRPWKDSENFVPLCYHLNNSCVALSIK